MDKFKKKALTLRQYLLGAEYFDAISAMEFASKHHVGLRKDSVTPEFDHQISIALYALTLPNLVHRQAVIATIMLHDVREDYHVTDHEIREIFSNPILANQVSTSVENMTKEWRGTKKDATKLFAAMAEDPIASIAKGSDRVHNFQSMVGVFKIEKQKEYIQEAKDLFLPMLKTARRNFPHQSLAYENIKHMLLTQIELIEAMHEVVK